MNVGEIVRRQARWAPDKVATIDGAEQITYGQLHERSDRLLGALNALGLKKGDRVATLSDNCGRYVEVVAAAAKGGLIVVPINPRLNASEVAFILRNSGPSVLIGSSVYRGIIAEASKSAPELIRVFYFDADQEGDRYEQLIFAKNPSPAEVEVEPDDGLFISYTSGTTGVHKGALMTHHNLVINAANVALHCEMTPATRALVVMPQSTGGCNHHIVLPTLFVGGTLVVLDARNFEPGRCLGAIQEHRITHVQLVPTMIYRLLDSPQFDQFDISSLQVLGYGSAPMAVERLREALDRFGPIFIQIYGQTEAGSVAVCMSKQHHIDALEAGSLEILGSSGRPINTVDVRIVDENGNDVPVGETGEVILRGDTIMQGYWNAPDETAEALRNGWLHTGDLARADDAGFIYHVDRKKDIIISGGVNISAREIEEIIYRHPGVRECAVIAVPDPHWGESVKAVIAVRDNHQVNAEEITQLCRTHLASFKCPRSIDFITEFPKSGMGKILKRELKKMYWQDQERLVS
ncbi:long-chain fatty acid--CoA ligase [Chelativorans sp. Marseille-P2723]|uniref:class I adenylate-forming enzyme family protein n=1 Tax=Chelativorans sp. Marseille-P2723 TaxID=2709133 RepID=UPI00156FF22D|nr:long-chain fatty acid--CoA ligase [Chelativorans sp. Marseille-P2723]